MQYLLDEIHSATVYSRPKESSIHIYNHWGIVVHNSSGSFLVHNTPDTGTIATPAFNMSNEWKPMEQIQVVPNRNIHGMFERAGSAYLENGIYKYVSQGFCTGAAGVMKLYLAGL